MFRHVQASPPSRTEPVHSRVRTRRLPPQHLYPLFPASRCFERKARQGNDQCPMTNGPLRGGRPGGVGTARLGPDRGQRCQPARGAWDRSHWAFNHSVPIRLVDNPGLQPRSKREEGTQKLKNQRPSFIPEFLSSFFPGSQPGPLARPLDSVKYFSALAHSPLDSRRKLISILHRSAINHLFVKE